MIHNDEEKEGEIENVVLSSDANADNDRNEATSAHSGKIKERKDDIKSSKSSVSDTNQNEVEKKKTKAQRRREQKAQKEVR